MKFDFETEQASPKWLTKILKTNGFLESGLVERVDQRMANVDAGTSAKIYALSIG